MSRLYMFFCGMFFALALEDIGKKDWKAAGAEAVGVFAFLSCALAAKAAGKGAT